MITIQDTDFHSAWSRAVHAVLRDGTDMVIGTLKDPKPIKDTCTTIELTGNAINQIIDGVLHPAFPFTYVKEYCDMFTYDYQDEYMKKPENEKFTYTYFERLTNRNTTKGIIDQLQGLKDGLKSQVDTGTPSNRNMMITWEPENDIGNPSPPCLQYINLRYEGRDEVSVKLHWRSHDLYQAWQINMIGIIKMLNKYVVYPNYCEISNITEFNDSLHVYESDRYAAGQVEIPRINPMDKR